MNNFLLYSQTYSFKNISIQQGLPQSQAYDVIFDDYSQAWIGTQGGGLCRYDGESFLYLTRNDSLISNRINCLYFHNNTILVGQKGGVTIMNKEGDFISNLRFSDQSQSVNEICFFDSTYYVASDKGLYVIDEKSLKPFSNNINLESVFVNSFLMLENELWCCTSKGLLHLTNPFGKINNARGLSVDQVECAISIDENFLLGTYGGGIYIYNQVKGLTCPEELKFLEKEIITCLYRLSNSEIWIGTLNQGVIVWNVQKETTRNYTVKNGLANNHVRSLTKDKWGNIWIGTSGGGVSIFQNSPFIKYTSENGLNGNYIYSVLTDKNENLWVATDGGGVVRINDTSSVVFDEEYGFVSDKVRFIFEDYYGNIWLSSESNGLGVYFPSLQKDTVFLFNQSNSGLTSNWIKNLIHISKSSLLVSTLNGGILEIKNYQDPTQPIGFKKYKILHGNLPQRLNLIFSFLNKIWFLSDDSFGYIENQKIFTFKNDNNSFRNVAFDNENLWLGSTDNGVIRYGILNDSLIEKNWINMSSGLASNNIYQLILNENILWVGTEKGIDKVFLNNVFEVDSITHFGIEEGFDGGETNSNASFIDRNGNVWFGTIKGLFAMTGNQLNPDAKNPPELRITDIRIFYESIENTEYASKFDDGELTTELILPYDVNHIGFSFKAIHFAKNNSIRYKWKLSGIDRDWTPLSTNTEATYGNLTPGNYKFSVISVVDNQWSVERQIKFSITPPYYQTTWFKVAYISISVLIISIIVFVIVYRIRRKNKRLKEKFEMEKNILELEQKALRLQMNPHFIFNVLNSIHNLIILKDTDKARYALAKFSKLMRQVLENSREKLISIDDELACIENYIQLERLTSNLQIELVIKIDEQIDSAEKIIPPLLIQPFVENSIIHGLRKSEKSGEIKIEFKMIDHHLIECKISDNGIGRDKAKQFVAQKDSYHKSTALKVTEERLASLKMNHEFEPIKIVDILGQNGLIIGTSVILKIYIE